MANHRRTTSETGRDAFSRDTPERTSALAVIFKMIAVTAGAEAAKSPHGPKKKVTGPDRLLLGGVRL